MSSDIGFTLDRGPMDKPHRKASASLRQPVLEEFRRRGVAVDSDTRTVIYHLLDHAIWVAEPRGDLAPATSNPRVKAKLIRPDVRRVAAEIAASAGGRPVAAMGQSSIRDAVGRTRTLQCKYSIPPFCEVTPDQP